MRTPSFRESSTKLPFPHKTPMSSKRAAHLSTTRGNPPMWKSFLQSMGLLTLAMLVALYSSGTSRDGNLPATIVAAVAALAIAAWVGVRFVPRLARGVDWAWMPLFAQYRVTREGGIFLGALILVLAAAINTNNNLLYMVLSALLAILLLSGVLSLV